MYYKIDLYDGGVEEINKENFINLKKGLKMRKKGKILSYVGEEYIIMKVENKS